MTDSKQHGRMPSDAQMESLLQDFFRLERPCELDRPFSANRLDPKTLRTENQLETSRTPTFKASRPEKVVIFSALAALTLIALLILKPNGAATGPDRSAANSVPDAVPKELLVSPNAHSKSAAPIGSDGVTLEETDSIELNPVKE